MKSTGGTSLGASGPLAKNGARTRGYTDTASDSGAPIRFTGGTMEDKRRKYDEAMVRQAVTLNDFHDYLDWGNIDRSNLTAEQSDILELVEQELTKKSVLGTLTEQERNTVFKNTLNYLYSHTKSANGDPYPIFIDIAKTGVVAPYAAIIDLPEKNDYVKGPFPEQIAMNTDVLSNKDLRMIFEYGRQKPANEAEVEKYKQQFTYKNNVYLEEMENYFDALKNGKATPKDRQKYLDQAVLRIYETCTKPIPVKDKRGKDAGTVPIGELIPPYDDSFGAQVAREALRLVGLKYLHKAKEIIPGENGDYNIDCSRLVSWTLSEINPEWKYDTISTSARYQINGFKKVWSNSGSSEPPYEGMLPGDTLFWKGNETGEIVHTAIYIGMVDEVPMMIEADNTVQIVEVREKTTNNNGEDSTLVQVNRMTPEELDKHHDQNTAKSIN
ncbi:MAG TPA: NlpC/P60 family protein [Clostridia bacterium]|nr:NlpC/P60 family protein [Clostridia bacterium]